MQDLLIGVDNFREKGLDALTAYPPYFAVNGTVPASSDTSRIRMLFRYNNELEKQVSLIQLNERFLDEKLEELERISSCSDMIEGLTLARLTELALMCAGNYANNGHITEVGDLILNPRLILVHIKGEPFPTEKERHTRMTVQFKDKCMSHGDIMEWLKNNTMVQTVKEPILPHLIALLEKNGNFYEYLESVRERLSGIVTLISQLSGSRIPEPMSVMEWISSLEHHDRMFMETMLYTLDKTVFDDLGCMIRSIYADNHF